MNKENLPASEGSSLRDLKEKYRSLSAIDRNNPMIGGELLSKIKHMQDIGKELPTVMNLTEQQHADIENQATSVYLPISQDKLHYMDGMKEVLSNPEKYGLIRQEKSKEMAESAFNAGAKIFLNSMNSKNTPYNSFQGYWNIKNNQIK